MRHLIVYAALLGVICACSSGRQAETPMAGSGRDPHGCIPSAGYSWCERERACVRSWELAAQKGFDTNQESFDAYCASADLPNAGSR